MHPLGAVDICSRSGCVAPQSPQRNHLAERPTLWERMLNVYCLLTSTPGLFPYIVSKQYKMWRGPKWTASTFTIG